MIRHLRTRILESQILLLSCWLVGCTSTPHIYWTEFGSGQVNASIGNANPATLASMSFAPAGIGADSYNLYWASPGNGTINKLPMSGGTPQILADNLVGPYGVAVDSTSGTVYWTNTGDGTIRSVSGNGGVVTVVAQGQMDPLNIVVDSNNLYWTDPGKGTVMLCSKQNCNPIVLWSGTTATDPALPWGIAVDTNNVYWTDSYTWNVYQEPISGGTPITLVNDFNGGHPSINSSNGQFQNFNPAGISVDAQFVYWLDSGPEGGGSVNKVAIGGGTPTQLFVGAQGPMAIALSDENIYWTDYLDGKIYWISKNCNSPCQPAVISSGIEPGAIVVQNVFSW